MLPTFKPWEELTISDNYMFQLVMQNPKLCKYLLEKILKIKIKDLKFPEYEKTIRSGLKYKSIRLDVYVEEQEGRIFDIEMQCADLGRKNLAKRSFMYQSMIASEQLRKGARYEELNPIFVIFICTFDVFGLGYPVYEFDNTCKRNRDILLENEVNTIFLNSKGVDNAEDPDIAAFLSYVDGKAARENFTKEIDREIQNIKLQEGRRKEYMLLSQEIEMMKDDLLEKGHAEGLNDAVLRLLSKGHTPESVAEDLDLSLQDVLKLVKK